MRRMPAGRRLSALVTARAPVDGALRQVARALAAWHAAAPRGPQIAAQGSRDALRARWQANIGQARASCGQLLEEAGLEEIERLAGRFTAGRAPLFAERIRAGRVVDGHGDLLADDIFCLDDGVRILDCLEFDDRLRWLDGLDDASFLAMDLERLGAPDLARRFTSWYAEYSGDPAPASLRHHYVAYRAFVRAKVACLRARCRRRAGRGGGLAAGRDDAGPPAGRGGHAGAGRRAAGHRQDHAGRGAGRSPRVHRAQQRPDPQGTGRRPGGATLRRAVGRRDLHRRLDRAGLRRAARPRRAAARRSANR